MPLNVDRFLEQGYDIVEANDSEVLVGMRNKIFNKAKEMVDYQGEGLEDFFNHFHHYKLSGAQLNEKRVSIVRYFSEHLDTGQIILDAFSDTLDQLVGPDVLAQKMTNLVIQQPGDVDQTPTHRDTPLNSPFEVVVWLPIVDAYGTKGLYVLDKTKSQEAVKLLGDSEDGYDRSKVFAESQGIQLNVPFGSACFFWPGLIHGCDVNVEQETRWSLNFRFRSLFAPMGSKGMGEFFKVLHLSPLARLAFEYEKQSRQEFKAARSL